MVELTYLEFGFILITVMFAGAQVAFWRVNKELDKRGYKR